jgi:hypothetical protein
MKYRHFAWRCISLLASSLRLAGVSAAAIAILLSSNLLPARAGTEVLGQLDAMELRAEHASTSEVLAALGVTFKLTYRLPPNINRNVNGLYFGSLRSVLARILDGTDYFIKNGEYGIEVIVLRASDASGGSEMAASSPRAPKPGASAPLPPLASYLTNN